MSSATKVNAATNSGFVDDHDPSDIGQKSVNKSKAEQSQMEGPAAYAPNQGIVRDERGQEQPADKKRAQQSTGIPQVSQTGQHSGFSSDEKKKGGA